MTPSGTSATGRSRRLALALLVLSLCCAWAVPAVADPGPGAPVGTPSPAEDPPEGTGVTVTPPGTAADPSGVVEDAPVTATAPTPERTGTPHRGDSGELRTAVEAPAEHLDGPESERTSAEWLGPLDRPERATSVAAPGDLETPTPATAPPSRTAADRGPAAPDPDVDRESTDRGAATATPAPASSGWCGNCGVAVPVGVVLLGLAGGAGAAAGLGLTPPQPTVSSSTTLAHWVDHRLRRLPPLVLGRFGQSADADPLAHTHRRQLRDLVDEQPGIHLGGLVDEVALSRSSVRHHVRVLEEAGELETRKLLGRRRLFPPDVDSELLAAVADEGSRRVVRAVAHEEPASVGRIADEAGRAYSTVSYHLDRLESAGVVTRESDGRRVSVHLTDEAAGLLGVDGDTAAD